MPTPPPPAPVPMRCLWHECSRWRVGSVFCGTHGAAARRAASAGDLPALSALIDLRPSQVSALTVPLCAPPAVVVPPAIDRPPRPSRRVCLWPDCERRSLRSGQSLCPRDRHRHRCLIGRGDLPDHPLTAESAAALPALWQAYLRRPDERRWPRAVRVEARPDAAPDGTCIAVGCDSIIQYGRGLCDRCYRRARYQGRLAYFPRRVQTNVLDPQPDPRPSSGDIWIDLLPRLPDRLRPHAEARRLQGIERYGVPLQPNNGRDPRIDAFQELLDGMAYAEQAVQEGHHWASARDRLIELADEVGALVGLEDQL